MPGKGSVGIAKIRAAVTKAAAHSKSVRRVADQIGLSYTAVRWFIAGGNPQSESLRRLASWYALHRSGGVTSARAELAIAIELLVARVNQAATPALKRRRATEVVQAILDRLDKDTQHAVRQDLLDAD